MGKLKSPVVWSRPDPVTGVRTDITKSRTNMSRSAAMKIGTKSKRPDFSAPMPDIPAPVAPAPVSVAPAPVSVTPVAPAPVTVVSGQEYVFEFSGPIGSAAAKYISKISKLLGGKRAYIEDKSKLVVVL